MLLTNKGLRCPCELLKMSLRYSNSIWLPPDKNSRGLCNRSLPPSTCQSQVQCRSQEASTSCKIKVGFCAVISWVPFSSCGKEWLKGQRNCLTSNHRRKNSSSQTSLSSCFLFHSISCVPLVWWGITMGKGVISLQKIWSQFNSNHQSGKIEGLEIFSVSSW